MGMRIWSAVRFWALSNAAESGSRAAITLRSASRCPASTNFDSLVKERFFYVFCVHGSEQLILFPYTLDQSDLGCYG